MISPTFGLSPKIFVPLSEITHPPTVKKIVSLEHSSTDSASFTPPTLTPLKEQYEEIFKTLSQGERKLYEPALSLFFSATPFDTKRLNQLSAQSLEIFQAVLYVYVFTWTNTLYKSTSSLKTVSNLSRKNLAHIPHFLESLSYLTDCAKTLPFPTLLSYLAREPAWNKDKYYTHHNGFSTNPVLPSQSLDNVISIHTPITLSDIQQSPIEILVYFRNLYQKHQGSDIPLNEILNINTGTPIDFIKQNYKRIILAIHPDRFEVNFSKDQHEEEDKNLFPWFHKIYQNALKEWQMPSQTLTEDTNPLANLSKEDFGVRTAGKRLSKIDWG